MTAEEFLSEVPEGTHVLDFLAQFAQLKCEEMAKVISEKAKTEKEIFNSGSFYVGNVDKQSILTAAKEYYDNIK